MNTYIFYTALALFVAGIINNGIYLFRVKTLLEAIKARHGEAPEKWDMLPLGLADASPIRTKQLLAFLRGPEDFGDASIKVLKQRTLMHLRAGYAIFGAIVLCVAIGFAIDML